MTIELQKAEKSDISTIKDILKENKLPFQDVGTNNINFFLAYEDADFIGIIGLEKFPEIALLRSMAVMKKFRGNGYGKKICAHLLEIAKQEGINEVFLLTCDAKDFFAKLGFKVIERKNVHEIIQSTTEFSSLCPVYAVCMKINL